MSSYDSHSLSEAEKGYVAMEKETLAIVASCLRWDHMLYGRRDITVETDRKPLIRIFEKPLEQCPKRLQRMRLTLQRFNLTLRYIPGRANVANCGCTQPSSTVELLNANRQGNTSSTGLRGYQNS